MIGTFLRATGAVGEFRNVSRQIEYLNNYVDRDAVLALDGVGEYDGIADYIEYTHLPNPNVNGKLVGLDSRNITAINWISDNELNVTLLEEWNNYKSKDNIQFTRSDETVTFVPCSTKVAKEQIFVSKGLQFIRDSTVDKMTPVNLCSLAGKACPNELFPFQDMIECLDFIASIPLQCDDGRHVLMGNTTSCRYLHAVASQLDPVTHCPHVAIDSPKCFDSGCDVGAYSDITVNNFGAALLAPEWNAAARYTIDAIIFIILLLPALFFVCAWVFGARNLRNATTKAVAPAPMHLPRQLSTRQFPSLALNIKSLNYEIKGRQILHNVSMVANHGLYAVMGVSGSGKSTLFSVISQRGVGRVMSGSVEFTNAKDGEVLSSRDAAMTVGVVEQDPKPFADANPQLTVKESVFLAAMSTLKAKAATEKAFSLANDAIGEMSLDSAANTALCNLSGGQLKRWSIATKLVSQTACLLLDEPTSSLDSSSALSVMATLRTLADSGRIVIATLHQPRSSILELIDQVLLMRSGGFPLYFGPVGPLEHAFNARKEEVTAVFGSIFFSGDEHDEELGAGVNGNGNGNTAATTTTRGALPYRAEGADALVGIFSELDIGLCGEITAKGLSLYFKEQGWSDAQWADCLAATPSLPTTGPLGGITLQDLSAWTRQAVTNATGGTTSTSTSIGYETVEEALETNAGGGGTASQGGPSWSRAMLTALETRKDRYDVPLNSNKTTLLIKDSLGDAAADMCDRQDMDLRLNAALGLDQDAVHPSVLSPLKAPTATAISDVYSDKNDTGSVAPKGVMATTPQRRSKSSNAWASMKSDAARCMQGTPLFDLLSFPIGCLIVSLFLCLLFPRLTASDLSTLYLYPASLLVALSALTNLNVFNLSWTLVRKENVLQKQQLHEHTITPAKLLWQILSRAFFFNWIGSILFFFPFYFIVNFYVNVVDFGWIVVSLLTLVLFMNTVSAIADLCNFFFSETVTALLMGLWLAYNALFAGVLIQIQELFVIWYPWASYLSPFWHVINTWILAALYATETRCDRYDQPELCPPTGSDAVAVMGYGVGFTWTASMLVILATMVVYYAVFFAALTWSMRKYGAIKGVQKHVDVAAEVEKKEEQGPLLC